MTICHRKETSPTAIPEPELPTDEPLGALEPVTYFNGAIPTGVTVSQQGRIFVNFPKWGDVPHFQYLLYAQVIEGIDAMRIERRTSVKRIKTE